MKAFQNWLSDILIYGKIFLISRFDTTKSNSAIHVSLFWQDRQASLGTRQENALLWRGFEEAAWT